MIESTLSGPQDRSLFSLSTLPRDLVSGSVVFLVALPLCLGIALASGAPLFSGLLAGIIGGIVVGSISGSHTSVSGPAAGLTAIVAAQITQLGSFEALLLAVLVAGVLQIGFGVVRAGALSAFFPSSVIKGLLAAIGVILILKQIPHLLGHDSDPEGEMSFAQPDQETTFSELGRILMGEVHAGAIVVGLVSIGVLVLWGRWRPLRTSLIPGPLVVVLLGVAINLLFQRWGGPWLIEASHLVQVPVATTASQFAGFLQQPDFAQWSNPAIYVGAVTIALVASLETLLNLEAVDKLDLKKRDSLPSRELIAQGCGNMMCGLVGGLPVTSVIVRSSVNVNAGGQTKLAAVWHGVLLLVCVAFLPTYLNMIPLSALAAILLVTGIKLASPKLFRQMWAGGRYQFIPFIVTLISIIRTDLLIGVLIGLAVSIMFILVSNLRRPVRRLVESRLGGDVTYVELANQVTFLNRAAIDRILKKARPGSQLLIDATHTDFIDPDVLALIREFSDTVAPARQVNVNLRGFAERFGMQDQVQFADYTTAQLQDQVTPDQVLEILKEGNRRFCSGNRLSRDFGRQVMATAAGQTPLAVILSCIDSRVPAELVFDLGIGDIFSVRVAGNVIGTKSLGSMEYGVRVAGVKLVLVLGHTRCGAVTSSVGLVCSQQGAMQTTGCEHLQPIVNEIAVSVQQSAGCDFDRLSVAEQEAFVDLTARRNVQHTVEQILERSTVIRSAVEAGRICLAGAMYDVKSGEIEFLEQPAT
ncbi:MAG: SulP family inorganic anion transporter [Planctomycetaceae bacterium]